MSETPKQETGLSLAMLKEILAEQSRQNAEQLKTVIEELKKPTVLEQKKLDEEAKALLAKNEERKENAAGQLQIIANRRSMHRICSHKHKDGNSHCVWVQERAPSPGYLLCQKNQCKIRPGVAPKDYKGDDIFDTELFNRIFQELPSNELFG